MASLKVTRAFFLARNHGKQLLCRNKKQPDRRNSYRELHEIHPSRLWNGRFCCESHVPKGKAVCTWNRPPCFIWFADQSITEATRQVYNFFVNFLKILCFARRRFGYIGQKNRGMYWRGAATTSKRNKLLKSQDVRLPRKALKLQNFCTGIFYGCIKKIVKDSQFTIYRQQIFLQKRKQRPCALHMGFRVVFRAAWCKT